MLICINLSFIHLYKLSKYYLESIFFKSLKPSFNIPTRHDLSNKLLTETFDNVTTRVHKRIEDADSIEIQCDA